MKISIECIICNSKIKNSVRCNQCNNFLCKCCIDNWMNKNKSNNTKITCPYCRKGGDNNFSDYLELNNLINSSSFFQCQKCNAIYFDKHEFEDHKIKCFQVKCMICHETFENNKSFIKHFEEEGRFQEKFIICNYLNANPFNCIQNNINFIENNNENENENKNNESITPFGAESMNFNRIKKYKQYSGLIKNEIKISPFKNNFKEKAVFIDIDESKEVNKNGSVLNKEYDIFYCNKKNGINNKFCYPGNELCNSCMKINQKYHKLKKHYLINSAGRVCTYNRNNVHCLCHFERYIEGNKFCPDLICFQKDICEPCCEMKKLIHLYLNKNLINKLIKRDESFGY